MSTIQRRKKMKHLDLFTDLAPFYNLKELVNVSSNRYQEEGAYRFERNREIVSISYSRFKTEVEALSTYIYSLGINKANLAVIGENSYEWIVSYFATVYSGNVIVPLDRDLTAEETRNLIVDSSSEILFYSDTYEDIIYYLKESCPSVKYFIPFSSYLELIEKGLELIASGVTAALEVDIDKDSLAAIIYTSGTTGKPKGVMLSHNNLASNTVSCRHFVKVRGNSMMVLPMHHSFGFTTCVLYYLYTGSELCINRSLKRIKDDFLRYKPYNVFMVPLIVESVYRKIWDGATEKGKDKLLRTMIPISNGLRKIGIDLRKILFKSVVAEFGGNFEYIITGGAPINDEYIKGLCDLGIDTVNGYGITECSPVVSVNRLGNNKIGSAGPVYTCCVVKIADPDEDGLGEILVKGDNVMLGYYNNPTATAEAFEDGWFKTGDIGYLDKDNFIYITGRKKSMIVLSNGKNIFPEELEGLIVRELPYVAEALVYSKDSVLTAEVYIEPEKVEEFASQLDEDIRKMNANLVPYKRILKTVRRDIEFEKTTTKKIKR